ncbi:hypothetical protein BDN71DRAFT_1457590 [Pleurotus eryngii]|uniref:Uncharacterized protein n=1 Tax=Pleurotus eryngii TaxID=5323 RepID=A0A9P6DA19_PLEER|nr:hypothetical protein BDN71DRAFT_1457590 [Pleurotus eryngii]
MHHQQPTLHHAGRQIPRIPCIPTHGLPSRSSALEPEWIEELEGGGQGDGEKLLCLPQRGFYLEHDEHLRVAVGRMVRDINRTSKATGFDYGVFCSLFHCLVVRVQSDGDDRSSLHTPALRFLPSRFADSPSAPGITALLRLVPKYDSFKCPPTWIDFRRKPLR